MKLIVDADDFHEYNHNILLLEKLKEWIPDFKITLFTVPGLCGVAWLEYVRIGRDWIDLVPHGKLHRTNYECVRWTCKESREYLDWVEDKFGGVFTHGFKAPGWQVSDGMYQALDERGWWIADQPYNNARRIPGLRAYLLDEPRKLHFHIGGTLPNEIGKHVDLLLKHRATEFEFVRDVV